eukprot:6111405-Alexandrium_andersonii.AAC.1
MCIRDRTFSSSTSGAATAAAIPSSPTPSTRASSASVGQPFVLSSELLSVLSASPPGSAAWFHQ